MRTNASSLREKRTRLGGLKVQVIPEGQAGQLDEYGCRKIVWQRDEGKLYIVCPGCGKISRHDESHLRVDGTSLFTKNCIYCLYCKSHSFVLLGGAATELLKHIHKNPRSCPRCLNGRKVETRDYQYHKYVSRKPILYIIKLFQCDRCTLSWVDPRSEAVQVNYP